MKRIIFSLLLPGSIGLFAQPTITQSEFVIQEGDVITVYSSQPTYMAPTEGASQIWDYTTLDISSPVTKHIVDPATSGITGLPATTICSNMGGSEDCFLIDASGVQRTGLGGGSANFPYQDAEYILQFPVSFGGNYTDSFYSSFVTSGFNGTRRGTVDLDVTGYGTLLLPNSVTINNVMQVKLHEITLDSMDIFGSWNITSFDYITHVFYAANYHGEILSVITGSTHMSGPGIDTTMITSGAVYQIFTAGAGIGSPDINGSLEVYPNPAEEKLTLTNYTNIDMSGFSYEIINMQGSIIKSGLIIGENVSFDLAGLNAGLYVLHIQGDHFNASKRFIKK